MLGGYPGGGGGGGTSGGGGGAPGGEGGALCGGGGAPCGGGGAPAGGVEGSWVELPLGVQPFGCMNPSVYVYYLGMELHGKYVLGYEVDNCNL